MCLRACMQQQMVHMRLCSSPCACDAYLTASACVCLIVRSHFFIITSSSRVTLYLTKPQRAHGAPWLIIVCVCFACALLYRERMRQAEIAFAEKEAGPRAVPQPSAYAHKPNTLGKSKERTCVNCFLGARSHTCFCTQT